jgi:hypothetical protein
VITGPDYTDSGRKPGSPFWGIDGTAVASVIAGHGHGPGGESGITGVAPAAKILSIRVDLEFNDPLNSDQVITRRLPGAIADGITYAVDHGARVIDLPLDPGTFGLTGTGDLAAADGSPAERAAVAFALRKSVVLVAPAGDDGQGPGIVNYPAAYTGVIAVGAVGRDGRLAPFSSRHGYVSLTAPGDGLMVATPPDSYAPISSTSAASGIVAGLAALILSRFPHLTVAQVTQALTRSTAVTTAAADGAAGPGTGYGTVNAARAVDLAADITSAGASAGHPQPPGPPAARPHKPVAAAHRASAGALAGSLVRDVVAGLGALIVLVVVLLLIMTRRRRRGVSAAGRTRMTLTPPTARTRSARGLHEHRRPDRADGDQRPGQEAAGLGIAAQRPGQRPLDRPQLNRPRLAGPQMGGPQMGGPQLAGPSGTSRSQLGGSGAPATGGWPAPGGWQGGGVGEIAHSSNPPFRPAMVPPPKPATPPRGGRGTGGRGTGGRGAGSRGTGSHGTGSHGAGGRGAGGTEPAASPGGPPWAPAPAPARMVGPLPVASASSFSPEPGPGIRVPGDMTGLAAARPETAPPTFDFSSTPAAPDFPPPRDFDFDFGGPRPAGARPAADLSPRPAIGESSGPATIPNFTTKESVDFAAAPTPVDYAPPAPPAPPAAPAKPAPPAAPGPPAAPAGLGTPPGRLGTPGGLGRASGGLSSGPAGFGSGSTPATRLSSAWDLASTDVFPAAIDADSPQAAGGPEASVPDDDPGAGDPGAGDPGAGDPGAGQHGAGQHGQGGSPVA